MVGIPQSNHNVARSNRQRSCRKTLSNFESKPLDILRGRFFFFRWPDPFFGKGERRKKNARENQSGNGCRRLGQQVDTGKQEQDSGNEDQAYGDLDIFHPYV